PDRPARPGGRARGPAQHPQPGRGRHHDTGRPAMRLMLAEDSALLREGLAHTLAAHGIEVTGQAADTAALLGLVDRAPPDVVLLDLRMPPTFSDEGLRAAEDIRAAHPDVAVLLLSQYADIALAARLVDALPPAAGYLLKERIRDPRQLTRP